MQVGGGWSLLILIYLSKGCNIFNIIYLAFSLLCCIRDVSPTTMHTMGFFHLFIIGHLVELTNLKNYSLYIVQIFGNEEKNPCLIYFF